MIWSTIPGGQVRSTWDFIGISDAYLAIFKIPTMVLLCSHLILLYLIHAFLMLAQSSPERIYQVNVFFLSIRHFKGFRDLLRKVVTFDAVKNVLRDQRSKNYERMAPKVSRGTLHRTPNRTLHFPVEIFVTISYDTLVVTQKKLRNLEKHIYISHS